MRATSTSRAAGSETPATTERQPSGGMTDSGEVRVAIFFHGQKFHPMSWVSYSRKAVYSQLMVFSPPSPM